MLWKIIQVCIVGFWPWGFRMGKPADTGGTVTTHYLTDDSGNILTDDSGNRLTWK